MIPDVIGNITIKEKYYDETKPHHKKVDYEIEGEYFSSYYDTMWHVNFPEEIQELAQYKLDPQPTTPVRIYAGGIKPVCYVFANKEEWEAVNPFKQDEEGIV